jgi:hypothetical protein
MAFRFVLAGALLRCRRRRHGCALAEDRLADANELIAGYESHDPRGGLRARVAELQRQLDAPIGTRRR